MSDWLPIESANPEMGEFVLIYVGNENRFGKGVYVASRREDGSWNIGKGTKRAPHPTHWQPLPLAPPRPRRLSLTTPPYSATQSHDARLRRRHHG